MAGASFPIVAPARIASIHDRFISLRTSILHEVTQGAQRL